MEAAAFFGGVRRPNNDKAGRGILAFVVSSSFTT
jgi:hypothetical protein